MRVRIGSFFAALLVFLAIAPMAHACSCAIGDPRDQLEQSDGAFIGKLVSSDPAPPGSYSTTYHFDVDEVFKGDIGTTVDVESSTDGASCGFEVRKGQEMGFFLDRSGGKWHGGLCGQIDPDELRKAAKPLAAPNGEGPLTFLAGGSLGEARTIGLDAQGRTLEYGFGAGQVSAVAVCPGSRLALEVVSGYGTPRSKLAIRDLESFEVVRDISLEALDVQDESTLRPAELSCRDASATDVLLFATDDGGDLARGRVLRFRGDEKTVVWDGRAGSAALPSTADLAYLASHKEILELNVASKSTRHVADVVSEQTIVNLSPDAKSLTARTTKDGRQRGHVIDVANGRTETYDFGEDVTGGPRELIWASDERVVAYTGGGDTETVTVFDRALKKLASWDGWYTTDAFVIGDTMYGAGWGKVSSAPYRTGPAITMRIFGSPEINALAYVPPKSAPPPAATPAAEPEPEPTSTPEPEASATPEATPVTYSTPTSEPSSPTSSSVPAMAVGGSALALAAGAIAWRRRSAS